MARKIFISVLGSTNYSQCKYQLGDFISDNCYFVQTATLGLHKVKETWQETDRCYILLTQGDRGSKKKNWEDCPGMNYEHGLEYCLKQMKLPCPVIPKDIKNEFDIWEIFNILYGLVEEDYDNYDGYELYIDITHSFRYIPMLLVVFTNFAKFMRQTTVKSITYGNWEARNPETNVAPFIDLTPLVTLQAWTAAADQFINAGSVDKMSDIMKPITTIDIRNRDERRLSVAQFMGSLRKMVGERQTCQGYDIIKSEATKKVSNSIGNVRNRIRDLHINGMTPFERIIDKIEDFVNQFSTDEDILNVFRAAEWCHNHGMQQQALTLLREGILTYLMSVGGYDWSQDAKSRDNFNDDIQEEAYQQNRGRYNVDMNNKMDWTFTGYFEDPLDDELAEIYVRLTDIRNQYSHGGMMKRHKSTDDIIEAIKDALDIVKQNLDY